MGIDVENSIKNVGSMRSMHPWLIDNIATEGKSILQLNMSSMGWRMPIKNIHLVIRWIRPGS